MTERPSAIPASKRYRVALLADVRFYREGLARALQAFTEIEVVGSAPAGADSLAALRTANPEIVLLDVAAARVPPVVQSILATLPNAKVVALAITDEELDAVACAEAGAAGYVSSEASIEDLTTTIARVACGEFPCSSRVASLLARRVSSLGAQHAPSDVRSELTAREREILRLIDGGLSNKEIAHQLGIVVSTVKNHVHHILHKSHVSRRGQAAARLRPWSSSQQWTAGPAGTEVPVTRTSSVRRP